MDARTFQARVRLVASWDDWHEKRSWYLEELIPQIVANGAAAGRDELERRLITTLQELLDSEEWADLSRLLVEVEKRAENLRPAMAARRNHLLAEQDRAETHRRAVEKRERQDARRRDLRQRREQAELEKEQVRQALLQRLQTQFESDFFGGREWLQANDPGGLIDDAAFAGAAAEYVTRWCEANLESYSPDREQAVAIASANRHALVGARAGSGKTATMVARAVFLVRGCGVDPGQILMLAFNRSAADEMRERIEKLLPGQHPPHVMTFHQLAYRLVHPGQDLIYDESETRRPLSRFVQDIVDEFVRDPDSHQRIRGVMLAYFRQDWSRIVGRGDNLSSAEQVEYRRHLQDESVKGDFVRSYGEKVIANTLFEHGLNYGYERDVRWNGMSYKPDFSVYDNQKNRRIVIEYFGMTGEPEYDEQAEAKRTFWRTRYPEVKFLEYYPRDVAAPGFQERLLADLRAAGAPLRRLTDDEIWEHIKKRGLDRFTTTVTTLIGRARQHRWEGKDLWAEWNTYDFGDDDLDRFISLAADILDRYVARLSDTGNEDFTGLMWHAVRAVQSGTTAFGRRGTIDGNLRALQHVVVDEFQDFSLMFHELLQQVLTVAPGVRVMAVGDDWQAINEFAGSTLEYFHHFGKAFPDADRLTMPTNRRSTAALVDVGNSIMTDRGAPARAKPHQSGAIREFDMDVFESAPHEGKNFGPFDRLSPALLRLIRDHRNRGRTVAVLSRNRKGRYAVTKDGSPRFEDFDSYGAWIRQILGVEEPHEVRFSTVHSFKGQEANAVILVDVTARNYPFIHPTWFLSQVFGDTIQTLVEAERRLFYVAASRARTHLDVVTTSEPSTFWTEAKQTLSKSNITPTSWTELREAWLASDQAQVEIRVHDSKEIKDQLKGDGYAYCAGELKYWWKHEHESRFDPAALLAAEWATHPNLRIEAWQNGERLLDHHGPTHGRFHPDDPWAPSKYSGQSTLELR